MPLLRVTALIVSMAATGLVVVATPVSAAEPVCQRQTATPGRPITDVPWAQQRFAPDRLAPLATGAGVTVAVIDSGVDFEHAQLKNRVVKGADFLDRGGTGRRDCVGHGTGVASIIAAQKVDKVTFRGLAPDATILPIRVSEQQELDDGTESGQSASRAGFAQAIDWAVEHQAKVINMSVVLYEDDTKIREAVARAVARDVVVVAAAGNQRDKGNRKPYPAAYEGVLGVGAIVQDGTRLPQSQVGPYVDVTAPGSGIVTAMTGGGQLEWSGTSFAAPFVSATAALLREYDPKLSAQEIARRIKATADPAPGGKDSTAYGAGILNPYRAVTETVTTGEPERAAPLPAASEDPAAVAARAQQAQTRRLALWVAFGGGILAALALLCAVVIPRGARRHWRPAA